MTQPVVFNWCRRVQKGVSHYEVSRVGDPRFSAFNAILPDGRSIEMHYQCDVKGYDPGGTNWRLGKGRPPLQPINLWLAYCSLWMTWTLHNPDKIKELRTLAEQNGYLLTDCFANTPINQARALAFILTHFHENTK